MAYEIPTQEPQTFAIGDTLTWTKTLADYLPADGWSLAYEIRGGANGDVAVQFASSVTNVTDHLISVLPAVTGLWIPGYFVLAGFAVNVSGERHQIYIGQLTLTPNLGNAANDSDVTTHCQRMIKLIEQQLEILAAHSIQDSNVEQTEIRRVKRKELEEQLAWNKELRRSEIAQQNAANGLPNGNKISPSFNIISGNYRIR